MAPDDETYQLMQEFSTLQQEFATLHRGVDAIRSEGRDLFTLKAEVDRLADDKDKLTVRRFCLLFWCDRDISAIVCVPQAVG